MDVKAITRRLDVLQWEVDKSRPCKMTVTHEGGHMVTTDPIGAWDIVHDHMLREDVVSITADRPEYAAAAAIMTVLCHPAPDRRIEDFG